MSREYEYYNMRDRLYIWGIDVWFHFFLETNTKVWIEDIIIEVYAFNKNFKRGFK